MFGPVVVKEHAGNRDQDYGYRNGCGGNERAPIFGGPFEAMGGGVDKFVVFKSLPGLLVHWFPFPFLLATVLPLRESLLRVVTTQNLKSISVVNRVVVLQSPILKKR